MKPVLVAIAVGMLGYGPFLHAQNCASAISLASNSTYVSDTTGTTNWMFSFGPLLSTANDQLYTFVAGPSPRSNLTPTASSYAFAMYLITSCSDAGSEPAPIRATATVGMPIALEGTPPPGQPPIVEGERYYLAVTGTAATGANGTLNFDTGFPVTLQTFTVD